MGIYAVLANTSTSRPREIQRPTARKGGDRELTTATTDNNKMQVGGADRCRQGANVGWREEGRIM